MKNWETVDNNIYFINSCFTKTKTWKIYYGYL